MFFNFQTMEPVVEINIRNLSLVSQKSCFNIYSGMSQSLNTIISATLRTSLDGEFERFGHSAKFCLHCSWYLQWSNLVWCGSFDVHTYFSRSTLTLWLKGSAWWDYQYLSVYVRHNDLVSKSLTTETMNDINVQKDL